MRAIVEEWKQFWRKKCFAVGIVITTLLSYITLLINPTVSIDDTAFKVYFIDGVAPAMGRWCLYLINKIIPLDYNPYFVEMVGLMVFCISIVLWCVVFQRLFGEQISEWGYTIFGCVMISSPILSEIVVWYLQNGLYLAYGVTALAILFLMDALREGTNQRKMLRCLSASAVMLTVAVGLYESFMIVYLMAAVIVFMLTRVQKGHGYQRKPLYWIFGVGGVTVGAMVMRTFIVQLIIMVFHLEEQKNILKSRGLYEVLGWFNGTKGWDDFVLVMQEQLVKYCLNGVVYLPILLLVLAELVLVVWGSRQAFIRKDGWIAAAAAGILMLPWLMPILEGQATYYRAAQYVPLLTAFTVLVIARSVKASKSVVKYAATVLACILLYRQCYEMNRWLYVDALKYEDAERTMDAVALEIQEKCDASKPVCIIGSYETPESLLEDMYCPVWSKKYALISVLVKSVNEELFEQWNTSAGYGAAETPKLSFINWGATAFYQFDRELIKFWKMHGFTFAEDGNLEHIKEAKGMMKEGPVWPKEGSIVEMEDYIIVNFGNY